MANAFYNRGASFNPDELADGDAIEAEFDSVSRGFDTIEDLVDLNKAGYPSQTFHVAPATEATHAPQKAQMDAGLALKLDAVNYNAADVLAKLKTVDGSASGVDADFLDGQHGSYYRDASNINAGTLAKERLPGTIDSSTTGTAANAELLDGYDSSRFSLSAAGDIGSGDWNTFTTHGVYKVNHNDFSADTNYPPAVYPYGILHVMVSELTGERRTMQMYYPHNQDSDKYIYQRMFNSVGWTAWCKIWRGGTGPNSGLQASSVSDIAPTGADRDLVAGTMADNDKFRIRIGGSASNAGWVEIATADDGSEPIYVRQYTGDFVTVARTLTLLDAYGVTKVPVGVDCTNGYGSPASGTVGNGICGGNGDNCTSTVNNLKVASWWGLGFGPSVSGQAVPYGEYSHWFNTRTGDVGCRGGIWAGNGYLHSVTVLTGDAWHGNWLPIPAGYAESQCRFFISAKNTNPYDNSWDLREGLNVQHYSEYFYLQNNRQVVARTRVYNDINDSFQYHDGLVNYIVIGYK